MTLFPTSRVLQSTQTVTARGHIMAAVGVGTGANLLPLHLPQLLGQFLTNVALIAELAQPCLNCAIAAGHAKPANPELALSTHGTAWHVR